MARDDNISAVRELGDGLAGDALIENVATYEFPLRSDFKARRLQRERAAIVVLRRRRAEQAASEETEAEDFDDGAIEVYDFRQEATADGETELAAPPQ